MFLQLVTAMMAADQNSDFGKAARYLSKQSAADLSHLAEATWQLKTESFPVRDPHYAKESQDAARRVLDGFVPGVVLPENTDHAAYAYMVENTRIEEIFRRVMVSFLGTEIFNTPSAETVQWVNQTEALFFREQSPFSVLAAGGDLRPDKGAVRRNLYYRLLGLDLNHGTGGKPGTYPYHRPEVANTRFTHFFQKLLQAVAVGIQNASNSSGPNPTDDFQIVDLVSQIGDALRDRRGPDMVNLAREEFVAVTFMSWLHLAISWESPVVRDLRATASTATERLRRIGDRVHLNAHQDTRSFLELGSDMSTLLRAIELGLPVVQQPEAFYTRGSELRPLMERMCAHWSQVTGNDVRAVPIRLDQATLQALGPSGALSRAVSREAVPARAR
ncbi:hypothetical protein [Streptomyces sp. NPDC054940]